MRLKRFQMRKGPVRSFALAAVTAVLLISGSIGAALATRPKPPPPSDPDAGRHAAAYCLDAIRDALAGGALAISLPGGDRFVTSIGYAESSVKVVYATQAGRYEDAVYDFAVFFTLVIGEIPTRETKIFGAIGPAWLDCTKAIQYYEQEKAKDVARTLQRWVFGEPGDVPQGQQRGRTDGQSPRASLGAAQPKDGVGGRRTPEPVRSPGTTANPDTAPPPDRGNAASGGAGTRPGTSPKPGTSPAGRPLRNMTIERLWTRNAAGADQTGFICGDQVRLSLSLANPNQRAVTATISFLAHNSERSLYNYDETLGIPAGPANYESPFNLPDDTDGEFDYVVMVQPAPGLSRVESSTTFTVTCGR